MNAWLSEQGYKHQSVKDNLISETLCNIYKIKRVVGLSGV